MPTLKSCNSEFGMNPCPGQVHTPPPPGRPTDTLPPGDRPPARRTSPGGPRRLSTGLRPIASPGPLVVGRARSLCVEALDPFPMPPQKARLPLGGSPRRRITGLSIPHPRLLRLLEEALFSFGVNTFVKIQIGGE